MAGKHINVIGASAARPALTPTYPGSPVDLAYTEGRQTGIEGGDAGDNPWANSPGPESTAWVNGFFGGNDAAQQYQTCWV